MENDTTNSHFSSSFRASGFASELEAGGPAALPHRDCARPEGLHIPVPLAAGVLATRRNGWAQTADMRSISWLYPLVRFSAPSALQASLKPKAQKKAAFRRNAAVFFVAERSGFEPEIRFCRIHAFQACLLSHSSISPEWECKYTESFCFFATLKNCFDFFAGFSLENHRIFHWNIACFST